MGKNFSLNTNKARPKNDFYLFHQLSEMIGKSSVNLDMENFIKYCILEEE